MDRMRAGYAALDELDEPLLEALDEDPPDDPLEDDALDGELLESEPPDEPDDPFDAPARESVR